MSPFCWKQSRVYGNAVNVMFTRTLPVLLYYPVTYEQVFKMVSFLQFLYQTHYVFLFSPHEPHGPRTSSFLISSSEQYSLKNTNSEVSRQLHSLTPRVYLSLTQMRSCLLNLMGTAYYRKQEFLVSSCTSFVASQFILPPELEFIFSYLFSEGTRIKCLKTFLIIQKHRKRADCIKEVESFGTLQLKVGLLFYFHSR